ncbi:MAG: flagellar basal body P-ring formation chaperone FlgA [Halieaceae bacterium]|uniref:flagellar basal body P-ring formation chaperone FlgA n=1 Tax=Haliea alexandrii TaxID=2448162 RepID=UPI000F0B9353|nr:flagellar basal body P-ring formation chaperone FlgA [Haliea alexandrii]MCR9184105.1 flagellar basal body P-ring formation chaperone FlgA [Halieaceae bacterium]
MSIFRRATAFLLLAAMAMPGLIGGDVRAETLHALEDVVAAATRAATDAAQAQGYSDLEISARPLDSRLRLQACAEPLETFSSPNASVLGPVSVGVRCAQPSAWTLYVRLDVSTRATLPVLTDNLPRGTVISERDLILVERTITNATDAVILDPQQAIGLELVRPARAGSTLRHSQLRPPQLIARGQTVTLIAGSEGLQVTMQGRAMANAAAGDRLLVTNLASGRRVEGIVSADGSVHIP